VESQRTTSRLSSAFLLLGANLLWAGQGTAVKLLNGTLGPLGIALLPLYAATVVGSGFMLFAPNPMETLRSAWNLRGEFFLSGVCGQLMAQVGMTAGVTLSTASNGAILSLLVPIFGAVIAVWLLRERLTFLRIATLLLGLAGVFLLSQKPMASLPGRQTHELFGNLLIAAGCFGSAFYNVYSKRLLDRFSGAEVLFFSYLTASLSSFPLFLFERHEALGLDHLDLKQWVSLAYLALLFYGVSMLLFFRALRAIDVVIASASLYLTPLFGVTLAYGVLGERLTLRAISGSTIVMLATLVLFGFDYSL
jgi:drug/metabolite transporter (DMT)-like permease